MPTAIVIDDDYASEILVENLGFRGYTARRINSATEALNSIDVCAAADVIVLDIIMARPADSSDPKISGDRATGMTILRALRARNQKLPILVFSATNDKDLVDAVNRLPETIFVSKWHSPSLGELIDKIDHMMGRVQQGQGPKVFIVHGHDGGEKLELKNYLQNTLKLPEPIILHEQPNLGKTIIEKLESYASDIDVAFVLLTPDDKIASIADSNDKKWRARQNVILELGYFLATFGRLSGRVVLLHKGDLDLPSR